MNEARASDSFRILSLAIVAGLLVLLPAIGFSQTSEQQLENSLLQAREALQELDELAADCLTESSGNVACPDFLRAVDGALLETYLDNCAIAKSWREQFVTEQVQDFAANSSRSETSLRHLIDVEYLCGENAVARATDNVLPAYRLTRTNPANGNSLARSLQYQLDSARQNALIDQRSSNLSGGYSSQSERSRQQIQRQFDRLELELIRQQNNQLYPR